MLPLNFQVDITEGVSINSLVYLQLNSLNLNLISEIKVCQELVLLELVYNILQ